MGSLIAVLCWEFGVGVPFGALTALVSLLPVLRRAARRRTPIRIGLIVLLAALAFPMFSGPYALLSDYNRLEHFYHTEMSPTDPHADYIEFYEAEQAAIVIELWKRHLAINLFGASGFRCYSDDQEVCQAAELYWLNAEAGSNSEPLPALSWRLLMASGSSSSLVTAALAWCVTRQPAGRSRSVNSLPPLQPRI